MLTTRCPAKINLTLHVVARRADGLHELESLVAFAGTGDSLSLLPGGSLSLAVEGPRADSAGETDKNLVLVAARNLAERVPGLRLGAFHLIKRLPVAAGIGGGSSDAAGALRLLAEANGLDLDDPRLMAAARATGADVPVCLEAKARIMRGVGEALAPPIKLPPLFAVLVNPGVAVATKDVFGELGLRPGEDYGFGKHPAIETAGDATGLGALLKKARNDLEAPASNIAPVIGHVLAVLGAARGQRLARMSGSGATCFALFETCRAAATAARVIRRDHPGWWVKASVLR
ncbi:4-(cytidine 5'-diphospho)-2-C-methyl-D-erythritol kinase [Methylovirgula sp. 4M-Z18]|uniref:4-(cytidine 5'-diphospho)-2-C-methyl-D-erythritol kinase n=1 Tax=Methylovirgula sp. 4M-Z18 TaxID=2293567 RepID=UPI000E2EE10A|nr:4-(cytidine 5'-diphospho)-2-C-methyl-D-erythritol kinase [Methylovirgula sp. 4M-Z18]RFB79073.1 4-(cytidine 5'-diphospho)-2-C-methyl-D-erythritol kinase [Methylovirgula sp. 4M-Z18]